MSLQKFPVALKELYFSIFLFLRDFSWMDRMLWTRNLCNFLFFEVHGVCQKKKETFKVWIIHEIQFSCSKEVTVEEEKEEKGKKGRGVIYKYIHKGWRNGHRRVQSLSTQQ